MINAQSGGDFIAPWDLDQLDDEWIEAFLGLAVELPAMQARQKRIDEKFAKWREKHSTYQNRYVN